MPSIRKDISGFPGYAVDSDGNVWSSWQLRPRGYSRGMESFIGSTWKKLKPSLKCTGYLSVNLWRDRKYTTCTLHFLVLTAFVGARAPGTECRHLDGNKLNVTLSNLVWGTAAENAEDQRRHGTKVKGSRVGSAKLVEEQVLEIRRRLEAGEKQYVLAQEFGVRPSAISDIKRRRRWNFLP